MKIKKQQNLPSIESFLKSLRDYVKTFKNVEKVILFGSFARGDATQNSDVDLAFKGHWHKPTWGEFSTNLRESTFTLRKLDLICYELSWKTIQKFVSTKGRNINTPKDAFGFALESR